MKKLFVFTVLIISICSCKKNNDTPVQSFIRFKLNGTQVECDNKIWASYKSTVGPDASITFYGRWQDNEIDFEMFNNSVEITSGQYVFSPSNAFSAIIWPNGTAQTNGVHYSFLAGTPLGASTTAGSGQIIITEINSNYIKRSFEFITDVNSSTGTFMTVTNGEFNIKR